MWKSIYDHLFLDLGYYVDGVKDFPINLFILAIAFGICVACYAITAHKRRMSIIIKQLYTQTDFA